MHVALTTETLTKNSSHRTPVLVSLAGFSQPFCSLQTGKRAKAVGIFEDSIKISTAKVKVTLYRPALL